MSEFKNLKELLDYVKASPDNHVGYADGFNLKEYWQDGEMRYVENGDLTIIGHYAWYRKVLKENQ